jgi:class 3 adenylate cyclase
MYGSEIAAQKQVSAEYRLNFGIGVCVGEAVVGNIGTPKLMNYTVIGDSVNKAKRLQESARGGQILISQETLKAIKNHIQVKPIGWLHLKGQAAKEPVYEVIGLKQEAAIKLTTASPLPALVYA